VAGAEKRVGLVDAHPQEGFQVRGVTQERRRLLEQLDAAVPVATKQFMSGQIHESSRLVRVRRRRPRHGQSLRHHLLGLHRATGQVEKDATTAQGPRPLVAGRHDGEQADRFLTRPQSGVE
jgi:hypothetical protein